MAAAKTAVPAPGVRNPGQNIEQALLHGLPPKNSLSSENWETLGQWEKGLPAAADFLIMYSAARMCH
jgi:hypothetical protein